MSQMKRCPFCGDEVEIVLTGLYHWKYAIRHKNKTECILDANAFALPYEKDDAIRMWNTRANRKTSSNNSEKPNNFDKDINVRSKDEPTTQMKTQNSNLTFEKRTMRDCYNCKRYETEGECIECHYEPKDEPQTDCAWK